MGVHKWSVNTPMVTFLFVFPPYQGCLYIQAYTLIYIKFWLNILCVCNYTFKMPDQTSFGCSNAKSDRCSNFLLVIYKEKPCKYLNGLSVAQKFLIAGLIHWKHASLLLFILRTKGFFWTWHLQCTVGQCRPSITSWLIQTLLGQ